MLEITHAPHRRTRHPGADATLPATSDGISPPCRYRKEFAGFHVCRATMHVAIVTARDCGRCPVPETLERVDCFFLRAQVTLAPSPQVTWTCGATDDIIELDDQFGCAGCLTDGHAGAMAPDADTP